MATPVTLEMRNDDGAATPVDDVVVFFYDDTFTFVTTATTDAMGQVQVLLEDGEHDVMFFKRGVSIVDGQPVRISVAAADTDDPPNTWRVLAHVTTRPESPDPARCRISGYVRGVDGTATRDAKLVITPAIEVAVVGSGDIVAPSSQLHLVPNADGYLEFDLLRGLTYRAYVYALEGLFGHEPPVLVLTVPNAAALDLVDLLFPVPVTATFEDTTAALSAGAPDIILAATLTYSDGSTRSTPPLWTALAAVSSDELVVTATLVSGAVRLTPRAPGAAVVTIERTFTGRLPYMQPPTFTTATLVVTVT